MNTLRQIETKKDLATVPKEQKVSVTFTRDEFDFLTDLIGTYEQIQIELMTETQLNRGLICAQLRSLRIVRERMSDASQKAGQTDTQDLIIDKIIKRLEKRKECLTNEFVLADISRLSKEKTLERINEITRTIEIVKSGGAG